MYFKQKPPVDVLYHFVCSTWPEKQKKNKRKTANDFSKLDHVHTTACRLPSNAHFHHIDWISDMISFYLNLKHQAFLNGRFVLEHHQRKLPYTFFIRKRNGGIRIQMLASWNELDTHWKTSYGAKKMNACSWLMSLSKDPLKPQHNTCIS